MSESGGAAPTHKTRRCHTPSFVCELPLRASFRIIGAVFARFHAGRQIYNVCLQIALLRLKRLRTSPAWAAARALPYQSDEEQARRRRAFSRARKRYGFTDHALQHAAIKHFRRSRWMADHLGTHEVQKLGTRAYLAAERILSGQAKRARFRTADRFRSLEGKNNTAGIRWRTDHLEWNGLVLSAIIAVSDKVVAHALEQRVKYVRIVLRRLRGRPRVYAQLVCEGHPYHKPTRPVGTDHVGVDFGPSTLAVVSERAAALVPFCAPVVRQHAVIRVLQRHLDRQRRANNPANYQRDGTIKPGRKTWKISRHERHTLERLAELSRREQAHRKTLHDALANHVVSFGRIIHREHTSPRALQRRYGKSVSLRAPGLFLAILRRKAESAGGAVIEIPQHAAKLSQTCHACGSIVKKPLSQRVHECGCGVVAQRDLYSAFLARHTDEQGVLHAGQARRAWPGAEPLLRAAWSAALQPAIGRRKPATFGTPPASWSQSGSLVLEGTAQAEAPDRTKGREAAVIALRTPRL